jgi:hypothetical protein
MKNEKPIIFSAEMVRAILCGDKTVTRRIVKSKLTAESGRGYYNGKWYIGEHPKGGYCAEYCGTKESLEHAISEGQFEVGFPAPYSVGQRLWVCEAWQVWTKFDSTVPNDLPVEARRHINYVANGHAWYAKLRAPLFMPRWASRITLEVVSIRVERLQEITMMEAMREGIDGLYNFESLWEKINGKRASWE